VNPPGLRWRLARRSDRAMLASFDCPSLDTSVEPFVRESALDGYLHGGDADRRLLLWFDQTDRLVAVAIHERNWRVVRAEDGELLPGTELVLIAVAEPFRDSRLDGIPLVRCVVQDVLGDIAACRRGPLLAMLVSPSNDDGRRVVERLGAQQDGTCDGYDVFVAVVGTD
jgi:hypothetical protein